MRSHIGLAAWLELSSYLVRISPSSLSVSGCLTSPGSHFALLSLFPHL